MDFVQVITLWFGKKWIVKGVGSCIINTTSSTYCTSNGHYIECMISDNFLECGMFSGITGESQPGKNVVCGFMDYQALSM